MQVEKTFGKTDMLDASAASIILQTFMDKAAARKGRGKKSYEEKNVIASEAKQTSAKITYDDFKKIEMKVGKILSSEAIPGSDKLYKLSVDFAEGSVRQIISGLAHYFPDPQILIGRKVAFVTNLESRPLMGLISDGMILAVKSDDKLALM